MTVQDIRDKLVAKGLKVTPQRMAVIEAIESLRNHPTADQIMVYVRKNHPNIASGTVYKVLETLAEKNIISKVKSDRDVMRYDADLQTHHHIYCMGSDVITDYYDEKLNQMLEDYFARHNVPGFRIEDFQLHIIGRYVDPGKCK